MIRAALLIAAAAAGLTILAGLSWPAPLPALADGPCIRATTSYHRVYPPQGTTLNRRPAQWATCTPWGP